MTFFGPRGDPLLDPYAVLGVAPGAADDDVARAFKRLALRLHPDKQPPDQTPAEAAAVAGRFRDAADARSFLLDGEHLAARREYDARAARARERERRRAGGALPLPPKRAGSATGKDGGREASSSPGGPRKRRGDPPASSGQAGAAPQKSGAASRKADAPTSSDAKKSDAKIKNNSSKKNIHVKQWGVHRPRIRPAPGRGDKKDATKAKTHPLARSHGSLRDSCGDCSATEDASTSEEDLKQRHTHSNKLNHACRTQDRSPGDWPTKKAAVRSGSGGSAKSDAEERARPTAEERAEAAARDRLRAAKARRRASTEALRKERLKAEEKRRGLEAEVAEKALLKAKERERRRAAEASRRVRIEAEERKRRLAAEREAEEEEKEKEKEKEAEKVRLAEQKERRLAAEAAKKEKERRLAAEAAEKARKEAEEQESRLAAEAAEEAEKAENSRLEAKEKERQLGAEAAGKARLEAQEKERRLAAEAAEKARLQAVAEEERRRLAAEAAARAFPETEERERRLGVVVDSEARLQVGQEKRREGEKERPLLAETAEGERAGAEETKQFLAPETFEAFQRTRVESQAADWRFIPEAAQGDPLEARKAQQRHSLKEQQADDKKRNDAGVRKGGSGRRLGGLFSSLTSARRSWRAGNAPPATPPPASPTPSLEVSEPPRDSAPARGESEVADFSGFCPAVDALEKQYHCPLAREIMRDPVSDTEGNCYERAAILEYLETHDTSPLTGNPMLAEHLAENTALKEKIRYTLKLKDCISSLQNGTKLPPPPQLPPDKQSPLCDAVDNFIKDLNSRSSNITMSPLDSTGATFFSYLGINIRLEADGVRDNVIIQSWFKCSKQAPAAAARVAKFNVSLQKLGLGGKLAFRNVKRKHEFTLTTKLSPEKFRNIELQHIIEYFVEMSIELHNIMDTTDKKRVDKVRLTSMTTAGQ